QERDDRAGEQPGQNGILELGPDPHRYLPTHRWRFDVRGIYRVLHQWTATFDRRARSLKSCPAPMTTVASGSPAFTTGRPVSFCRCSSSFRRKATPPVSTT